MAIFASVLSFMYAFGITLTRDARTLSGNAIIGMLSTLAFLFVHVVRCFVCHIFEVHDTLDDSYTSCTPARPPLDTFSIKRSRHYPIGLGFHGHCHAECAHIAH